MSGKVDTNTVEMRFDNKNFESNAKQSMSTLEKLKQALKLDGASAGLKEVENASKKLDFKDTDSSITKLGKKFSLLEEIAVGVFRRIGEKAADAGMNMVKSLTVDQVASGWNKYAEKTTAVQTIMANLKDDAANFVDEASKMEYVERYLDRLMWFSDETSYSFTDMTGNVGKFIANGQGLEDSVTAMQGIATWAAMSGQNAQTASRAMYNISQAMGVGSMKIKDWMSIENANMATAQFKELAIMVGENQGKLKKGAVSVESFRESLSGKGTKDWFDKGVMMEVFKTYGEAADRIREYAKSHDITSTEAIREIKEQDAAFADSIGFKAFAAAQEAKTFSEVVAATADAVSTKWLRFFENIFGNYLEAKELWTGLSEDLWDIFAAPLDEINSIMAFWKRGFFGDVPKTSIDIAYEMGELDKLEGPFKYVTKELAKQQVAADKDTYSIRKLDDGTEELVRTVKTASGAYETQVKKIYKTDKELFSGRSMLITSFKNLLDTFFHDTEDEKGNEILSVFGAIRKAFLEVFFPGEKNWSLAKRLVDLTKRFQEFTEKIKPSEETITRIKNVFKGLFTVFKIGFKFVSAILKPFREFFGKIFGNVPENLLELGDSMSSWLQELEKFLDTSKVFETVSTFISNGLERMSGAFEWLSQTFGGLSLGDFVSNIKNGVLDFFKNYDFQGRIDNIVGFFSGIVSEIQQVKSGDLPEKLTPIQEFYVKATEIFDAIYNFFANIGSSIGSVFSTVSESAGNGIDAAGQTINSVWNTVQNAFQGIVDFFQQAGPTFEAAGQWISGFFSNLVANHDALDIIKNILSGGLAISGINLVNSMASALRGVKGVLKGVKKNLYSFKGVINAYQHDLNASAVLKIALAIAVLAGSFWLLAKVDSDKIDQAAGALTAIAGAVGALVVVKEAFSAIKELNDGASAVKSPFDGIKDMLTSVVGSSIFANDATAKFVKICLGILLAAIAMGKVVKAVSDVSELMVKLGDPSIQEAMKNGGKIVGQILIAFAAFAMLAGITRKASAGLWAALGVYILVKALSNLVNTMADLGGDTKKLENVRKVTNEFKDVFEAIGEMVRYIVAIGLVIAIIQTIVAVFGSLGKNDTNGIAKTLEEFGKNFMRIAFSLVLVAVAIGIMAIVLKNIDPSTLSSILWTFGIFVLFVSVLGGVAMALVAFGNASGDEIAKVLEQIGKLFTRIAASLVIVAAAFAIMALVHKFDPDVTWIAGIIFGVFAAVGLIANFLAYAGAKDVGKAEAMVSVLNAMSGLFIALGVSLVIVAAAFAVFSLIDFSKTPAWEIGAIFAGFLVIVGLIGIFAGALVKESAGILAIAAISALIITVAASLLIVAGAFAIMASIKFQENASLMDISIIFGVFVAIAGALGVIAGKALKDKQSLIAIAFMAGFILTVAASLLIVAGAFAIMASIKFQENASLMDIGAIFLAFMVLVGILAVVGANMVSNAMSIAGIAMIAGLMLTAAVSLLIVGIALSEMSSKMSPEQMYAAVEVMVAFALVVGLLAAIGTGLAATGVGIVGMAMVAVIILAIGAACLMAGAGIALMVFSVGNLINAFSELMAAIAEHGPEFAANLQIVVDAVLDTIINSAPKLKDAAIALITAFAYGLVEAAPIVAYAVIALVVQILLAGQQSLRTIIPIIAMTIIDSINVLADTLRASGPLLFKAIRNLFEAVLEMTLESIAMLIEPIPIIGEGAADAIIGWIPGLRDAFKVIEDESDSALDHVGEKYNEEIGEFEPTISLDTEGSATKAGEEGGKAFGAAFNDSASENVNPSSIFEGLFSGDSGMSSLTGGMTESLQGMNLGGIMGDQMGDVKQSIVDSTPEVNTASKDMAKNIEKPITSLDSYKWGEDIGTLLSDGLLSKLSLIEDSSNTTAQVIHDILGFSEPKKGPLSNFHTYAPDMIKLWCSGVKNNLHFVRDSSTSMSDTVRNGFSTALDYVSSLIDDGMTDELTIRPIMDLSEIQNGVQILDSMLAGNNYPLYGTANATSFAARDMQDSRNINVPVASSAEQSAGVGNTYNNTFNITNNDPDVVADKVSRIIQHQTKRQQAVWAN